MRNVCWLLGGTLLGSVLTTMVIADYRSHQAAIALATPSFCEGEADYVPETPTSGTADDAAMPAVADRSDNHADDNGSRVPEETVTVQAAPPATEPAEEDDAKPPLPNLPPVEEDEATPEAQLPLPILPSAEEETWDVRPLDETQVEVTSNTEEDATPVVEVLPVMPDEVEVLPLPEEVMEATIVVVAETAEVEESEYDCIWCWIADRTVDWLCSWVTCETTQVGTFEPECDECESKLHWSVHIEISADKFEIEIRGESADDEEAMRIDEEPAVKKVEELDVELLPVLPEELIDAATETTVPKVETLPGHETVCPFGGPWPCRKECPAEPVEMPVVDDATDCPDIENGDLVPDDEDGIEFGEIVLVL